MRGNREVLVMKKKDGISVRTASGRAKKPAAEGAGIEEMRSLITRMAPVLRCAEYDAEERPLLECPGCGLAEDMDMDGNIITYIDGGRMKDTGYRFAIAGNGTWVCPICHTVGREDGVC
jgi:hypothetical protein